MDPEIIKEVCQQQTHKIISRQALYDIKQRIKKVTYHWYNTVREGQSEFIHEFQREHRRNTGVTEEAP